jgi:SAM-dependent methyltransferase
MLHFYKQIQGWSHYLTPFYHYIVPKLPDSCRVVEVGCWMGRSTACLAVELLDSGKAFELTAVDHWLGTESDGWYYQGDQHVRELIESRRVVDMFRENLKPVIEHVNVLEMPSEQAATTFADSSLDLVTLDDDHSYEGVKRSIRAWLPKIKPGGYLAGDDHDRHFAPLKQALIEIFSTDYQVIGTNERSSDGSGNGVWLWQKPESGWTMPEIRLLSEIEYHVPTPPEPEYVEVNEPVEREVDPEPEIVVESESEIVPEPEPVKPSLQNPRHHNIIIKPTLPE